MSIDTKLQKLRETKEALRVVGEIDKNEPFSGYPAIFQEKISSSGTNEDGLIAMRRINNKLYLDYLFYYFPTLFFKTYSDANSLQQVINNTIINWCKNNNLENVVSLKSAFSYWNAGSQKYINYDIDISNWTLVAGEPVDCYSCFYNGYFKKIKLPNNIKIADARSMFSYVINLIEVEGILDITDCIYSSYTNRVQRMFEKCSSLEKVYVKGLNVKDFSFNDCPNLMKECLTYLLNNAIEQTETKSLILGSTNLAKLTAEEIAVGTNKGFTIS